jgi:Ran GTPase-activating protein (RanGAP) involved in mRNA processing and transport
LDCAGFDGHPSLQELSLVYNQFGETSMVALQGLLSCPSCKLLHLDLSGLSLYNRGFRLGPLIRGLQNNHSLQKLYLSKTWRSDDIYIIEDNKDKDIREILIMLWQCPNLLSIDLSNNAIGNLGIFQNQVSTATDKTS